MKKRNKKTGKVQTCDFMVISDDSSRDGEIARLNSHVFIFRSIEQLNEEYEDYKPAEPLIKDKKIRKAVRAWAKLVPSASIRYDYVEGRLYTHSGSIQSYSISFPYNFELSEMTDYTIAELCGEATDEA